MPNKTHRVASGDTFEGLSNRYFGEPSQSGRIRQANPGATDVLVPGTTLIIPANADDPAGTEQDGLIMRIGGVSFRHVTKIAITRRIDAVDTVEISAPQAETDPFKELITPLSFRPLDVSDGGDMLFRGTLVPVAPQLKPDKSIVKLGGYSLPGVLSDCMMPASSYPIQFRNMGLEAIARQLADPFSVGVSVEGDLGGPFKRVKLKRTDTVMSFLAALAKQRQVLIRSNSNGDLVLAAPPAVTAPVATLKQGDPPILSIEPQFSPQSYYSHITGVRSTRRGLVGSQHTVLNPLAQEQGIFRPLTISMRDTSAGELPKAVEAAAGRMLAGAVTYTVEVATWRDPNGAHWVPGSTLQLEAPSVFVRKPYDFQIRSVKLKRNSEANTATLLLMLPGAFGGEPPSMLPWTS
jgi:prophage tail gpP-like protein